MDTRYDHTLHEKKIYDMWEQNKSFDPDSYVTEHKKPTKSFSIMMPPPNANDPLHIGHAMFVALEDVLIRYHRMLGDDTLWLPGTDHAGIETQFVFENKLKKEGKSRFDYDRSTLYKKIWDYVQENSDVAVAQIKKLGASADWSRFKFMLDKKIVEEVLKTFKKLHETQDEQGRNLIYRDLKLVNYCTRCGTSYSELEVNHTDREDPLYTFQYGPLQVSTVRPETIFGDVALAVHPDDVRYSQWVGKTISAQFPWGKVELPVIADDYVKMDFGTGVLKITPYHDQNDWDVWQRHLNTLAKPRRVINNFGKLINVPQEYAGLGIVNARQKTVEELEKAGLLLEKKNTSHSVGTCYRCGRTIEPLPLPQFFVRVAPLTKPILEALDKGEFKVHGAGHDKILRHWLENLRDWNISRQIVWGISLPIWYPVEGNEEKISVNFLDKNGDLRQGTLQKHLKQFTLAEIKSGIQQVQAFEGIEYLVSREEPQDNKEYIGETDTFDTWFSSAQWPFSTLKTTKPGDFKRFYPTQVMETGYDILPFWVMRMLMIGQFVTGELPFHNVYLHGLVRDPKGQKMSKSKGNVVNPLEITEKYGADALRMALVIRSSAGLDKSVGEPDFKAMRNLTNKLWNSARFILTFEEEKIDNSMNYDDTFQKKLFEITAEITKNLENFQIGLAAETLYNEFWHWFCDECIEKTKNQQLSKTVLFEGLVTFLKLFHPFIPFVTEAVWQILREENLVDENTLIAVKWPTH